jgi:hypothetical protein
MSNGAGKAAPVTVKRTVEPLACNVAARQIATMAIASELRKRKLFIWTPQVAVVRRV